jgi:hypothetical protein
MELTAGAVRQSGMMTQRQVRGTVVAVVLCAALAGCGSVAASTADGAPGAGTSSSGTPATQAGTTGTTGAAGASGATGSAVGCASVGQATKVTIRRSMHLVEPARASGLNVTQQNQALVRALFRDFCNAVGHPDKPGTLVHCPASFGMSYTGTFYDGSRSLATFVFGASGCQTLSVTAAGKRQSTLLYGKAAAAAPHLWADMAAVLGVPKYAVSGPVNTGSGGGTR